MFTYINYITHYSPTVLYSISCIKEALLSHNSVSGSTKVTCYPTHIIIFSILRCIAQCHQNEHCR